MAPGCDAADSRGRAGQDCQLHVLPQPMMVSGLGVHRIDLLLEALRQLDIGLAEVLVGL